MLLRKGLECLLFGITTNGGIHSLESWNLKTWNGAALTVSMLFENVLPSCSELSAFVTSSTLIIPSSSAYFTAVAGSIVDNFNTAKQTRLDIRSVLVCYRGPVWGFYVYELFVKCYTCIWNCKKPLSYSALKFIQCYAFVGYQVCIY